MAAEHERERVIVDLHARELRLSDFKSTYAQAFTECLDAEDRVLQSLTEMRQLERALSIKVDFAGQHLLAGCQVLAEQHRAASAEIAAAGKALGSVYESLQRVNSSLLGPDGSIVRAEQKLLGIYGKDSGVVLVAGLVHKVHNTLTEGPTSVAGLMHFKLTKSASAFEGSIEGTAARLEHRIKQTAEDASKTVTNMADMLDKARRVQQNWLVLASATAAVFSAGLLAGAVLIRTLMP